MSQEYDRTRQMVDLAVSAGRRFQSPQTGLVHYCFFKKDEEHHDTIPVYENFLFALALMRFRMKDSIEEGKKILHSLLPFQILTEGEFNRGNFPIYLHQFPRCYNRGEAARILPVLCWIKRDFHTILGNDLKERLRASIEAALYYSETILEEKELDFITKMKIGGAERAFGTLFDNPSRVEMGDRLLGELLEQSHEESFGSWFSPQQIGDTLVALQLAYPEGVSRSPWKHFWAYLSLTLDRNTYSYCGPAIQDRQWKKEPMSTFYDLFVGHIAGRYDYRSFRVHPFQLQGALVHEMEEYMPEESLPIEQEGSVAGYRWSLSKTDHYAYSLVEKRGFLTSEQERGFQPFRLIWGSTQRAHTFVCQGGNVHSLSYERMDDGLDLLIEIAGPMRGEDAEHSRELMFFVDKQEGVDIRVAHQKATTFRLADEIQIKDDDLIVSMTLTLEEGEGKFMGHIQPANRPSQKDVLGESRFRAYDWALFLRTLSRGEFCRLRAKIRFAPQEALQTLPLKSDE